MIEQVDNTAKNTVIHNFWFIHKHALSKSEHVLWLSMLKKIFQAFILTLHIYLLVYHSILDHFISFYRQCDWKETFFFFTFSFSPFLIFPMCLSLKTYILLEHYRFIFSDFCLSIIYLFKETSWKWFMNDSYCVKHLECLIYRLTVLSLTNVAIVSNVSNDIQNVDLPRFQLNLLRLDTCYASLPS